MIEIIKTENSKKSIESVRKINKKHSYYSMAHIISSGLLLWGTMSNYFKTQVL